MPETLSGFVERVTYHNPENGFAVLRVKVKGRVDLVSLVGITTSVTAGEHVEASGRWVIDRQHGQQFKADELKTTHPASAEGIEKNLASLATDTRRCGEDFRNLVLRFCGHERCFVTSQSETGNRAFHASILCLC